jgi:putative oxidoreductase
MITTYRRAAASLERVPDLALLLARLTLGLLFIDRGLQKYQGQGGLAGFEYFLRSLRNVPAPALTSHVVPAIEVIGGAALIAGLLTRVIALLLAGEMVVTGFLVKAHDLHAGLVSKTAAGVELDLLYLVLLVSVLLLGPGRAPVDRVLRLEHGPKVQTPQQRRRHRPPLDSAHSVCATPSDTCAWATFHSRLTHTSTIVIRRLARWLQYGRTRPMGVRRSGSGRVVVGLGLRIWMVRISGSPCVRSRGQAARRLADERCGAMMRPSGSSSPVSSKRSTPLHSRLQPCSGCAATT